MRGLLRRRLFNQVVARSASYRSRTPPLTSVDASFSHWNHEDVVLISLSWEPSICRQRRAICFRNALRQITDSCYLTVCAIQPAHREDEI